MPALSFPFLGMLPKGREVLDASPGSSHGQQGWIRTAECGEQACQAGSSLWMLLPAPSHPMLHTRGVTQTRFNKKSVLPLENPLVTMCA